MSVAKISREEFAELNPYEQARVVYSQGSVNDEIPNENPYERGSDDYKQFERGMSYAKESSKFVE